MTATSVSPLDPLAGSRAAALHQELLNRGEPITSVTVQAAVARAHPLMPGSKRRSLCSAVLARADGLGRLDALFGDPTVSELMINGPGPVWVERQGRIERTALELERDEIDRVVERMVAPIGRRVDQLSPQVDGRLPDGSRVNIVVPPIAIDGPYVTVRRFVLTEVTLESFADAATAELVRKLVDDRANIVVSGSTGAGKTTLLNTIAGLVGPANRIITVEDAAELRLDHPHVVRLETRPESAEGAGRLTVRDLVRNALRMRPDRLVVGEVRGDEALDLVTALNTGHRGCLATVHANGPRDALRRLETLAVLAGGGLDPAAVREQITAAVDAVVHVERSVDGLRRIASVAAVSPASGIEILMGHDHRDRHGDLSQPRRGEGIEMPMGCPHEQ